MNFLTDLNLSELFTTLPLLGLYAETHFRFWIPFSRYFRRQPELIFDAPWRLQPGQVPTIFLVIKDAHLFSVQLHKVEISISQKGRPVCQQTWLLDQRIEDIQTDLEFVIDSCEMPLGEIEIAPVLYYSVEGKPYQMEIDNYLRIFKPPLRITIAEKYLPRLSGWQSGDTHLHSSLTSDQIEFGASLEMTRKAAELFGLEFITATDHSYDLDDYPDNYLENDPDLQKWKASRQSIKFLNDTHTLPIIPGEEISVANKRGATVHLLHYNDPIYFPGSGDSGDEWPKVTSQLKIEDIIERRSGDTVSVGAHTAYPFPWLPRVLLNRGTWEATDHDYPELDGVQILCGTPASRAFQNSRQLWIDALLKGHHLAAYGGSDGHGNFNRNWHVKLPTWSIGTHEDQIFAQSRTLLRSTSNQVLDLIQAMKDRRTALTTGPVGDLTLFIDNQEYGIGDIVQIQKHANPQAKLTGLSTPEFGAEMDVTLYWGDLNTRTESIIYREIDQILEFDLQIPVRPRSDGYLRLEITSDGSRWPGLFLSSPIWIQIESA